MDKETLYEKAEKVLNQAFEAAKSSVKMVSKKAGEAAEVTKLLIEKASLEHRVSKKFTELGHQIYDRSLQGTKSIPIDEESIQHLLEEVQKLEQQLSGVESSLKKEKRKRKSSKSS